MSALWMKFQTTPQTRDEEKKYIVRYTTPTLGFSVEKEVTEAEQRLLMIAVEVGKEEMKAEIHNLLRMK